MLGELIRDTVNGMVRPPRPVLCSAASMNAASSEFSLVPMPTSPARFLREWTATM
jgi:hypothetical protein